MGSETKFRVTTFPDGYSVSVYQPDSDFDKWPLVYVADSREEAEQFMIQYVEEAQTDER